LGKSAGNAIWLDADMTPPFELYQVSKDNTSNGVGFPSNRC
jgi:tyrosyl-tRNA synthetase